MTTLTLFLVLAAVAALVLGVAPVRRRLISAPVLALLRRGLPQVSQTEQEALDAGTVWWERDLFQGKPDWSKLLAFPKPRLNAEEQAFMDGPVEELCAMVDEWRVTHELRDLPPEAWQYIKDRGFFGMIIPKEYGGLGFSAYAHSQVVTKLASRSTTAAVTVMVPNSLGPAELLLHYGTEEQKRHYLPRLAKGLEIPCFALTSPEAGSDAASIPDFGIVCRGEYQGRKDVLGIRVTWDKRYITLGPVATLLGLAFQLRDPERLLGGETDVGITLALLPTSHPGVHIGRRHLPLDAAFQNGPNWGKDVFIPMEFVIGGRERCGQGWRMLMNCLAAGRSISLPSNSAGGVKLAARATGAYSRVRVQFKTPIGRFEGVEEALARIGGNAYIMDAARAMTAGAVDLGEKPSVASAIVKYHLTERARQVVNDAMDVHGGKGICLGPNNYLGRGYQYMPIGITVEGANILTRSLIIFGQGAIRCHPFLLDYVKAANDTDRGRGLVDFDRALFGHARYMIANVLRSVTLALTGARFASAPAGAETSRYYQKLARLSAAYAVASDAALLILGGEIKRREKLSARLGDVLAQMYLASAALKRFQDDGRPAEDVPFLAWSVEDALYRGQQALAGVLANFPSRVVARLVAMLAFPLGRPFSPPSDRLGHEVAELLLAPGAARDRLTAGIYIPRNETEPVGALEIALESAIRCEAIEARLRKAVKDAKIGGGTPDELAEAGLRAGIITQADADALVRHKVLRRKVVMVDDFEPDFGMAARRSGAQVEPLPARKTA
ncbi:MAG TPA: acyl-CoA dehydrogenase [Burkholderiales bacterium]|nr:acyl-CoA dehydrogenase [Burkholderiales bacterium]